ncbi:hypothetical protein B0H15DRAFT_439032 [Mycena belliarum]|uniref:Uncharacterized protein n=1 Tax=Mycena belliarum TaxID=1033014 RepID=A0AAD6U2V0_9AGAR|nr:hypothetical protein B0H15DRAFT_439032 [Mycena belliae]
MRGYCGSAITPGTALGMARALRLYLARTLCIYPVPSLRSKFGLSSPDGVQYALWFVLGDTQNIRCGGGWARTAPRLWTHSLLLEMNKVAAQIGCARKHWVTRADSGFGGKSASRGYSGPQPGQIPRSPLIYKYWRTSPLPSLNPPPPSPSLNQWL